MWILSFNHKRIEATVRRNKFSKLQKECYNRNMNCDGCFYSKYKCRVKYSIIEHIKKQGVPDNVLPMTVCDDSDY